MSVMMLGFGRNTVLCLAIQFLILTFVLGIPSTKNQSIQAKPRADQYDDSDYIGKEASDDEYDEPQNDGNDDDGNDDGVYDDTDENPSDSDPSESNDTSNNDPYPPRTPDNGTEPDQPSTNQTIPDHLDWREHGYVTAVQNQAPCNCCCWAFALTAIVEGLHMRKTGHLVRLSEQNLVDCETGQKDIMCHGSGELKSDFTYTKTHGLEAESSYKYTGKLDSECKFDKNKVVAKISQYHSVPKRDEEAMKKAVALYGPIFAGMDANHIEFNPHYKGGIYNGPCSSEETDLDHAVVIVGYGTEKGQDYWLLKNSWGTDWGEKGYFKLPRNNNTCGIAWKVKYVT